MDRNPHTEQKGNAMTIQYEYKFVTVKLIRGFLGGVSSQIEEGYRKEIVDNAKDGWRFVQAFAPPISKLGASLYADLIFERETSES
jgi:hypothetical protein